MRTDPGVDLRRLGFAAVRNTIAAPPAEKPSGDSMQIVLNLLTNVFR